MTDCDMTGLSLDEIIQKDKSLKRRSGGANRTGGRIGRRRSGGVRKTIEKPQRNGTKKWDHDKFFEQNSANKSSSSNNKAICRLANIAYSVTLSEMKDLFSKFRPSKVVLHYDESGRSLGTGEVHASREAISRLVTEFGGAEIDGRKIELLVVDTTNSRSGPTVVKTTSVRRGGGGGRVRRSGVARRSGGGRGLMKKKKMTAEELDRELDEYMKKSRADN